VHEINYGIFHKMKVRLKKSLLIINKIFVTQ